MDMKKLTMALLAVFAVSGLGPIYAQRVVEPNELKVSPNKYRYATITLRDIFVNPRIKYHRALSASGYTRKRYITFAVRDAGMRCFLPRTKANEELVAGLKKGDRVTIVGVVKQTKAEVERAEGRITDKYKLDIYIVEVQRITRGWEAK